VIPTDSPCERCHEHPATVGFGDPPEWLCLNCYERALADVGQMIAEIRLAHIELDADVECAFCGFETTEPGWITEREPDNFGVGPGTEPLMLCQLCRSSFSVGSWLAGLALANDQMARDQLMIGNVLRRELRTWTRSSVT